MAREERGGKGGQPQGASAGRAQGDEGAAACACGAQVEGRGMTARGKGAVAEPNGLADRRRGGGGKEAQRRHWEREREERGMGCAYENKQWRNSMDNNRGKLTEEDGVRVRREENHRLAGKRRSDRRIKSTRTKLSMRRTQRYSQISPMTHGLKVIAQRSCHSS
jgi:hypothetical protein